MLENLLQKYIEYLESDHKAVNTIKAYSRNVSEFFSWFLKVYEEDNFYENISSDILWDYQDYLIYECKFAGTGIQQRMISVQSFLKYLNAEKYINVNPTIRFKMLQVQEDATSPDVPTKLEMRAFLREVYKKDYPRDIAIIELFRATGIRAEEMINLDINDLIITPRKGYLKIRKGKGNKSREQYINKTARRVLNDYLAVRNDKFDTKKLWIGTRGPLTQDALNKMIKRYAKRLGDDLYKKFHPHIFRHYLAKRLLEKKDLVTVKNILGHTDIRSTAIYLKPSPAEIEKALDDLDDMDY